MKNLKKAHKNKKLLISLAFLVVIGGAVGGYALVSKNASKPSIKSVPKAANSSNPNSQSNKNNNAPAYPNPYVTNPTPTTKVPAGGTESNTSASGSALVAPFGQFVSNYGPVSYSANDGSNQEESICQTTIGATCSIEFLQGQTTEALKPVVVKSENGSQNGVASWSWTPNQVGTGGGLTPGEWEVEAVATLNGTTKTTISNIKLNIQQ